MSEKIYICGPISSLPITSARLRFEAVEKRLIEDGFVVVNPMKLPHNHNHEWESYMREDIIELMKCDAIYVMAGFGISQGAKLEFKLAIDLKFKIYMEHEN